jgi:hypothetical protein
MGADLLLNLLLVIALRDTLGPPDVERLAPDELARLLREKIVGQNLTGCAALFANMTEARRRELLDCYVRGEWFDMAQRPVGEANELDVDNACNTFIKNLRSGAWHWERLGGEARRAIDTCAQERASIDVIRQLLPGLQWLPHDLLYNPYRQFDLGADLLRTLLTIWQWQSDNGAEPDVWFSARYEAHWARIGLNASHYAAVREASSPLDALDAFRLQHGVADYMAWNDVAPHHMPAARWLLTLFSPILS